MHASFQMKHGPDQTYTKARTLSELTQQGHPIANRKRVYRIMSRNRLLLEQACGRRSGRLHDGEVMVEASNIL